MEMATGLFEVNHVSHVKLAVGSWRAFLPVLQPCSCLDPVKPQSESVFLKARSGHHLIMSLYLFHMSSLLCVHFCNQRCCSNSSFSKSSVTDPLLSSIDAHLWCVVVFSSDRFRKRKKTIRVFTCAQCSTLWLQLKVFKIPLFVVNG